MYLDPRKERPVLLTPPQLNEVWQGEIILVTKRFTMAELNRQFNLKWFIPVVVKYKKLFADVLVASFFLQLFGLITPLFS